jgi:cytochrome c553
MAPMLTLPYAMKTIPTTAGDETAAPHRPFHRLLLLLGAMTIVLSAGIAQAQQVVSDTIAQRTVACVACHGKEGRATSEGYFPRIAGKPAGYLYNQLINFREGRRRYPMMTYMVDHLSDAYLQEMAQYFSNLHPPYPAPQSVNVSSTVMERGRALVTKGDASKNIPACIACHGSNLTGVAPAIPGLVGLPRDYLNSQFGAWKNGGRKAAAPDCMAQITERLSVDDISAVSAWLSSQPVPNDMRPASSASVKLPIPCGGVSQSSQ